MIEANGIRFRELGRTSFTEAEHLQRELSQERGEEKIPDTVLLLEHPPVYTCGKQKCEDELLQGEAWRREHGIDLVTADRGGRLTYHGPGQLVGYLILRLSGWRKRIPVLVERIEDALIELLAIWKIQAFRDPHHPGVWVSGKQADRPPAKIAAIGLHVSHEITRHGFALNVSPDLSHYAGIVPCGIGNRTVTSMEALLGTAPPLADVIARLQPILAKALAVC